MEVGLLAPELRSPTARMDPCRERKYIGETLFQGFLHTRGPVPFVVHFASVYYLKPDTVLHCLSRQADNTDANNVPRVAQSELSHTFLHSPVFKKGEMSPASFVVSSAPSPELMAATTRTRSSLPPE